MDICERLGTHICGEIALDFDLKLCARHSIVQVAYQRILQLTYIDDLLSAMRRLFIQYFEPVLSAFVASLHTVTGKAAASLASSGPWDFLKLFKNWDALFDRLLNELEVKSSAVSHCHYIFFSSQSTHGRYRTGNQARAILLDGRPILSHLLSKSMIQVFYHFDSCMCIWLMSAPSADSKSRNSDGRTADCVERSSIEKSLTGSWRQARGKRREVSERQRKCGFRVRSHLRPFSSAAIYVHFFLALMLYRSASQRLRFRENGVMKLQLQLIWLNWTSVPINLICLEL